jgi:hypothetical protein
MPKRIEMDSIELEFLAPGVPGNGSQPPGCNLEDLCRIRRSKSGHGLPINGDFP